MNLLASLREKFGFENFHPGQEEVVSRVLAGTDTLAILATGAGKSLCYQLPALMLEGTTVVVSPLIALMKDQLDMLHQLGVHDIVALNSTLSEDQELAAIARIRSGTVKIVFVTPEKLEDQAFVKILGLVTVPLFVIDEAHCISQWGHDFRPAYLGLGNVIAELAHPTVLALTATATPAVREDILAQLGIPHVKPIVKGFDRPNLQYDVRRAESESEKLRILRDLFRRGELEGTGIIYTATIKNALEVQSYLTESLGLPAAVYHSKLQKRERVAVHELFMNEEIRAVVATNAFGLGIDKPNIRFVVHFDLPGSIEAYTQEAGRAGRDGKRSRCTLLYRMSDTRVQNYFLTGKYPAVEEVQKVYATLDFFGGQEDGVSLTDLRRISQLPLTKLKVILALLKKAGFIIASTRAKYKLSEQAKLNPELVLNLHNYETKKAYDQSKLAMMLQYCESSSCRRKFILNYFGEDYGGKEARGLQGCGACDNCRDGHRSGGTTGYRIAERRRSIRNSDKARSERAEKDLVTVLFPGVGYKTLLATAVSREAKIA